MPNALTATAWIVLCVAAILIVMILGAVLGVLVHFWGRRAEQRAGRRLFSLFSGKIASAAKGFSQALKTSYSSVRNRVSGALERRKARLEAKHDEKTREAAAKDIKGPRKRRPLIVLFPALLLIASGATLVGYYAYAGSSGMALGLGLLATLTVVAGLLALVAIQQKGWLKRELKAEKAASAILRKADEENNASFSLTKAAIMMTLIIAALWLANYAATRYLNLLPPGQILVTREWSDPIHVPSGMEIRLKALANVAYELRGNPDQRPVYYPRQPENDPRTPCEKHVRVEQELVDVQLRLTEANAEPTRFEYTLVPFVEGGPCPSNIPATENGPAEGGEQEIMGEEDLPRLPDGIPRESPDGKRIRSN